MDAVDGCESGRGMTLFELPGGSVINVDQIVSLSPHDQGRRTRIELHNRSTHIVAATPRDLWAQIIAAEKGEPKVNGGRKRTIGGQ